MFLFTIENFHDRLKTERLYLSYRKLMYKEAFEIVQNQHCAEDAVSESFVRIIDNLHKIDEQDCLKTRSFLVIICRNVAKNIYNKKIYLNNQPDAYDDVLPEDVSESSDSLDILVKKETLSEIAGIIKNLDPIYRDVFLLKNVHGVSRAEIAAIFGISEEAVKKRLVRAKSKILKELEKRGELA